MSPRTTIEQARSLGFQTRRCHRAFDRVLNATLGPVGLSSGFWYFLRALEGRLMPTVMKINTIAGAGIDPAELDVALSVLSRMSANLEAEASRLANQPAPAQAASG